MAIIREHFPYLAEETVALVHARRCRWLSALQLGMYMLERARERGTRFLQARVEGVKVSANRVDAVRLHDSKGLTMISTPNFVNAGGPFLKDVGRMIGVELPVFHELHAKVALRDPWALCRAMHR